MLSEEASGTEGDIAEVVGVHMIAIAGSVPMSAACSCSTLVASDTIPTSKA